MNPSNDTVCAGRTARFVVASDRSAASYMWEVSTNSGSTWDTLSGVSTDTLYVSGVTTSMSGYQYRAFAIDTFYSSPSTAAILDVITAPSAGSLSGASSVCVGDSVSLSSTVSGGVWTSSTASVATVSSTGYVYGVAGGADTIYYTVTNTCGATSAVHYVAVNAVSAGTLSGSTNICVGYTQSLSSTVSGGTWFTADTAVSVTTTGSVTGMYAGIAVVKYAVSSSCGHDTASISMTVGVPSVSGITGATHVCVGDSVALSDSGTGTWATSNASVATISAAGMLHGVSAGIVNVHFTVATACGMTTVSTVDTVVSYSVNPILSSVSNICVGDSAMVYDSTSGGTWTVSDTTVASVSASGLVRGIARGSFMVTYTATTPCGAVSVSYPMTVGAIPTGTITLSVPYVCNGNALTATETLSAGMWSLSDTMLASIDSTGAISTTAGSVGGIDTVFYTVTNACGTASTWVTFQVDTTVVAHPITGPNTVCIGGSITMSNVNPSSRGHWNVAVGNASISGTGSLTGVSYGVDTVFYTYTNACNSVSSTPKVVRIDTGLTAGTISTSTHTLCVGSWTRFSSTHPGGMWFSSDFAVATPDTAGFLTARGQGTAIVSYVFFDACGAFVATDTLHVQSPALPIGGSDSVGVGATETITDLVAGGSWSSTASSIFTVDSATGLVTGVSAGSGLVTYTVTNICGTTHATKTIYVGVPPTPNAITGPDTVCPGDTVHFANTFAGGYWGMSNNSARIALDGSAIGDSAYHHDTVMYSYHNAFGTSTVYKDVYVNGVPRITYIDTPSHMSVGLSYRIVARPAGGTWVSGDVTKVSFISGNMFVILRAGDVPLVYTVSNACGTSVDTFWVRTGSASGIENVNSNESFLNVYPNPNNGNFSVNLIAPSEVDVNIVVTNVLGQKVKEATVKSNTINEFILNQPAGMYQLEATTKFGKYSTSISVTGK